MQTERTGSPLSDRLRETLLDLSRLDALYEGNLEATLRSITRRAARALDVERVGVWRLEDERTSVRCVHGFDAREGSHAGERLEPSDRAAYFGALREARQIDAADVREDPRTAGLAEEYFTDHGISALLASPVWAEGELWGAVCHEDRGEPREWTAGENQFAASVGDLVGRAVEARRRRDVEETLMERNVFLDELVRSSPGIIFRLEADGLSPDYVSPNFEEATGYPEDAFLDRPDFWLEHMHPEDRERVIEEIRNGLAGETDRITQEYRFRHSDGEDHWYHAVATVEREDGTPVSVIGHALDITARKRAEETLRASEARFRALFEQNVAGAYHSTFDGELLRVNEAFAEIFGYEDPTSMDSASAWDLYGSRADREELLRHLREHGHAENFEFRSRRRDGSPVWLLENAVLVDDPARSGPTIMGTLIDISERKRLEQELEHMAFHDPLTGAANRRLLEERAEQAMAMADRQGERVAVLYLDLTGFKEVNDTLGHDAGDRVLEETASRLDGRARDSDTVARVGGDEFAVLLTQIDSPDAARRVGEELTERLHRPLDVRGRTLRMDARVGAALFPDHAETFEDLLVAADRAMYQTSGGGRGAVVTYEAEEPEGT